MTELNNHYEPEQVESSVKQRWNNENTYEKVKEKNKDGEDFYFLDGPPFTSGRMHCGTAWGKLLKDAFLRYYRMNGYNVKDTPGYDTHGLPIEVKVEQEHGFERKQDIVDYGVEEFVKECKQYVHEQKEVMDREFKDMGVWMNWDNPYLTMNKSYMETVWSSFNELYKKDLVGRGFDVLNTCPRCETTLSDSELDYGNRTVEATYVGFDLKNYEGTIVAWTTTPWTVVGNQFVAVNRNVEYASVRSEESGELYYVATDCIQNLVDSLEIKNYNIEEFYEGSELVGMEYSHPLPSQVTQLPESKFYVRHADYVEAEKTGFVHSAPGFGHEDYERGSELGLHPYSPVKSNGEFSDDADGFGGMYVHTEGADAVAKRLADNGKLLATEHYTHEYPHCPRCDTDVVFQATDQWFFKATEMKEGLQSAIDKTDWFPQDARDERFRNTVKNAPDWNISRQRYWGTPLPVWVCQECDHDNVLGSSQEILDRSVGNQDVSELEDLHRPSVDPVKVECENCGGVAERVEDVLDVWFDSSVASWGSLNHRPSSDTVPDSWPSDLIVEGHDQTRGWFLMQLYLGVALSDQAPYKDVLMHGFAMLDGKPMSKSRGHVLRPPDVIDKHGRDAMRSYMLSNEEQESDVNMTSDMQGVESMKRKLDVVWNVYRFSLLYMDQDDYVGQKDLKYSESERTVLDNWVLSRLDNVRQKSTEAFENREPNKALSETLDFLVNDVSRYYVKSIRDRVWVTEDTQDKMVAYDTLTKVMAEGCKLLAPFTPYLSEKLYENLPVENKKFSVHAEKWARNEGLSNRRLESEIGVVRHVEEVVSHLRDEEGRKQRWPVKDVWIVSNDSNTREQLENRSGLMSERLNAFNVHVTEQFNNSTMVVEPEMSKLGPEFGSASQEVGSKVDGREYSNLPLEVQVEDEQYTVDKSMVEKTEKLPNTVKSREFREGRILVDFEVTDSVEVDGYTRDLVRQAQEMRADMELEMETRVNMSVKSESDSVLRALNENRDYFKTEVRVNSFSSDVDGYEVKSDINGDLVVFEMEKTKK